MVLINVEQLSDAELAYIAQQENIENRESLSRAELIETLEEFYDSDTTVISTGKKFVKSLTAVDSDVLQLPGVEPLPASFNDTEIQMIMKDPDWAYVIWGIDINTSVKLKTENSHLIIKTIAIKEESKEEQSYEVEVGKDDNSWNIELPWKGRTYRLELIASVNGEREVLACSKPERIPEIYLQNNTEVLLSPEKYKLFSSSLSADTGNCIDCIPVREIFEKYSKESAK